MNNKIKLIVTDDASEFTQENLNILQSKNISVIFCAKDGEELCDKIKRESPDVVLMDSFMTRLDCDRCYEKHYTRKHESACVYGIFVIPQHCS